MDSMKNLSYLYISLIREISGGIMDSMKNLSYLYILATYYISLIYMDSMNLYLSYLYL